MRKRKKRAGKPRRTADGGAVWLECLERDGFVFAVDPTRIYLTEDLAVGGGIERALDRGATVAEALEDAEVQAPLECIERVCYALGLYAIRIDWVVQGRPQSLDTHCAWWVRDAIFDEMARRLGDDFTRGKRRVTVVEFLRPLKDILLLSVWIAVAVLVVLGLVAWAGFLHGMTALIGAAVAYAVAVVYFSLRHALLPVYELVRAR